MRRRRRRRSGRAGLLVSLVGLAILTVFAASPRHREFYGRLFGGWFWTVPPASMPSSPKPPAPRSGQAGIPAAGPAGAPGFFGPVPAPSPSRGPLAAAPETREPSSPRAPTVETVVAVPHAGPGDRVVVAIVDETPARLPFEGAPPGWVLKEFSGRAEVEVVRDRGRPVLRLGSHRSSFALYRDLALDVKHFPLLTWMWKVTKLPVGGDVRERASDDQAAQVYVIFPRWPSPRVNSDVLGYVWDSRAPEGLRATSSQAANVRLVVLRSGDAQLGQWVREERDVYRDYVELFGKEPPRAGKIAIMIDSNNTQSEAEAFFEELTFRRGAPSS